MLDLLIRLGHLHLDNHRAHEPGCILARPRRHGRRLARVRSAVENALIHPEGPSFRPSRHPIEQEYAMADRALRERLTRAATRGRES
jgi:hypothetical protein